MRRHEATAKLDSTASVVKSLAAKGYGAMSIGRRCGVSESTVWKWLKRHDVVIIANPVTTRSLRLLSCIRLHGTPEPGAIRAQRSRLAALDAGWPSGATTAEGLILGALYAGCRTVTQVAVAAGRTQTVGARTRLARFAREGWVVRDGSVGKAPAWRLAESVRASRECALARLAGEVA